MKKKSKLIILSILFIIGLIVLAYGFINIEKIDKKNSIIGNWYGSSSQIEMNFILSKNYNCVFLIKDLPTGKISKFDGVCSFDFTKSPHSLDIQDAIQDSLYTIINFINPDTIRIARFSKKWRLRPISFNQNDLILIKVDKK
jgi:hypothetical protein